MLQFIRDRSQSWISWVIVSIVCLIFALWGVKSYMYSNQIERTVAKVNGTKVSQQSFLSVYNQMRRQQQYQYGPSYVPTAQQLKAMKQTALKTLIANLVLIQAGHSAGFRSAPELAELALSRMPVFQVNGAFSEARFQQVLSNMLYSPEQFFNQVQNNLLIDQIKNGIVDTAFVTPREIDRTVSLVNQKRTFHYVLIPVKRFLNEVTVPEPSIRNYYKQHQSAFKTPEKVSVAYLKLSLKELMKKIKPTHLQLQLFYQNNISSYTIPKEWQFQNILIALPYKASSKQKKAAKEKIDHIVKQIKAGVSFDKLVKHYSDDGDSAKGGKMQWLNGAQLPEKLRPFLSDLSKISAISIPVRTARGYEIYKTLGYKPSKVTSFNKVKKKVLAMYRQQKAEAKFASLSDQLANLTYETPNTLAPAAKQLGLTIQTTSMFTKAGGKQGLIRNPKIIAAAFSSNVLSDGNNSDSINTDNETAVVLRIDKHQRARLKPLAEVKPEILKTLRHEIAQKQALDLGVKVLSALNKGSSLDAIAKRYSVKWQFAKSVSRQDKKVNSGALMLAFKSFVPTKAVQLVNGAEALDNGDYVVVSLSQVIPGSTVGQTSTDQRIYARGTAKGLGYLDYSLYAHGLMKKAKIKKYPKNIN